MNTPFWLLLNLPNFFSTRKWILWCRLHSLHPPFQPFSFDNLCFSLTILNEFDKTSLVISKSGSPFLTYSVILHSFKILLHPLFWILGFDSDRYRLLTLLLLFEVFSNSPTSKHVDVWQSVIIQERSNSNNPLLSFYTPAHEELGTRNNPIDVNQLLDPSPSPPHIPVYTPPRTRLAPVTAPCPMCHRHGHMSTQCVWYGPGICSYCKEVGHTVHNCNILHRDQQRFNPHLLYYLTCKRSGHTSNTRGTLPSYQ